MMTDADKPAFVAALTELALLKPGATLTKEGHRAWWNAMREKWTLEEFRDAAAHLRDTLEFMPNPFHFEQLRKTTRVTVGEAWAWVLSRYPAHRCQVDTPPEKDLALIERAVQAIGGWRAIDMCDVDKVHFLERRFAEHYEQIQDADEVRTALPQIAHDQRSEAQRIGVSAIAKQLARMKQ